MQVYVNNIVWDTDGENVSLPNEVTIDVDDGIDLQYEIADYLSDEYGWCVIGYNFEIVT